MSRSTNLKECVCETFKKRLCTNAFKDITVSSLCIECKINRKTFYNNFEDKYKLAIYLFENEFINLVNKENLTLFEELERLCFYFENNKTVYKKLFSFSEQPDFITAFKNYLLKLLTNAKCKSDNLNLTFLTNSLTVNFYEWLTSSENINCNKFYSQLKIFLQNFF